MTTPDPDPGAGVKIEENKKSDEQGEVKRESQVTGVKREMKEEPTERKRVRFGGGNDDPVKTEVKQEKKVELGGDLHEVEAAQWGAGKGEGLYEKPPDVEACFKRVNKCEWDSEAWELILRDLKRRTLDEVEDVYKRILSIFPSNPTATCDYVTAILCDRTLSVDEQRSKIDLIFMEKLRTYQHVSVWNSYTDYVRRHQDFAETQKAYDLCLKRIGHDFESDRIWDDYIKYLSSRGSEFRIQTAIRKAYHDRLKIPMHGLEASMKAYIAWERTVGPFKVSEELRQAHERAVYHYNTVLGCYDNVLETQYFAKPLEIDYPEDIKVQTSELLGKSVKKDFEQAALWYTIINKEMDNPMGLEASVLKHRISTMCKKALICMAKVPLFWYVHSRFLCENDNYVEANKVFSEGLAACPTSLLLRFAYADMLAYLQPNKLLDTPMKRQPGDGQMVQTVWQHEGQGMVCEKGVDAKRLLKFTPFVLGVAVFEDMLARVPHGELRTLAWVHYMRFLKSAARLEEQQEAYHKEYLQRAHSDASTLSGPFYTAVARLEKVNPPQTPEGGIDPRSILERGYMRQKDTQSINPLFLLSYIQMLWGSGDASSLRNLFSQLFEGGDGWQGNANKNTVLLVHNKRVEFELWKGSLKGVHSAEKNREDTFGKAKVGTYARQLVHRYTFEGLIPASAREIQAIDELEHAFFRLLTKGSESESFDDILTKSMKLHGESPIEENLSQHANPLRSRRAVGEPEVKTKWIPYQLTVSKKWSRTDEKPSRPIVTGTWNPKLAPRPEKDVSQKSYLTGSGATRLAEADTPDDYSMMPSTVAHLARKLPDRKTFQGEKPKVDYIIDCFKKAIIPPLVEGKIPDDNYAEAKQYLKTTLDVDMTSLSSLQVKAREKIEALRADIKSPEDREVINKCTLALAQVLTHARARREAAMQGRPPPSAQTFKN